MNKHLLHNEVQIFIRDNLNADLASILFKKPVFEKVSNKELAQQLEARKKCEKKLPTWFGESRIYYPEKLSIEQTSSELAAWYKAKIVSENNPIDTANKLASKGSEKSLLDVTGGFGIDSYYFAGQMKQIIHCEINAELSQIAAHNFEVLGVKNIECIPTDGISYLRDSQKNFDWIYLDPSRRNDEKNKVFRLSECLPDVTGNLDLLFSKSENVLIKSSPLLDLSVGVAELRHVTEIHIIAIKNEVKELLWVLKKGFSGEVKVKTINFGQNSLSGIEASKSIHSRSAHLLYGLSEMEPMEADVSKFDLAQISNQTFDFGLLQEKKAVSEFSEPLSYLYEPNAAILKSGAFKTVGIEFGLKKLHEHTHLYTSKALIPFPGRRFKVERFFPYDKKKLKSQGIKKANITTRNFPESVLQLRKKFKIGDGGTTYLFFTTDSKGEKIVIECLKI